MRGWSLPVIDLELESEVFPTHVGMVPIPRSSCSTRFLVQYTSLVFPAYAGISQRKKDMTTEKNPDRILNELEWQSHDDGEWMSYHTTSPEGAFAIKRSPLSKRRNPPFLVYFTDTEGRRTMIASCGRIPEAKYRAAIQISKIRKDEHYHLI